MATILANKWYMHNLATNMTCNENALVVEKARHPTVPSQVLLLVEVPNKNTTPHAVLCMDGERALICLLWQGPRGSAVLIDHDLTLGV